MTKDQAFDWLKAKSVSTVKVHYHGGGDEGNIDQYDFLDADDEHMDPGYIGVGLDEAFEQSVYDAIGESFGDGEPHVDGTVLWHVDERRISIEHGYQDWQEEKGDLWPVRTFAW